MPAILTATDLQVRHHEQVLLDGASLAMDERDRVGMVGRNGSGKSTLLRILAGHQSADAGEVTQRRELVIGYLPQDFALDHALTVAENIRAGARAVLDLIREFEALPPQSKRHAELEERIHALDGWGLDHRLAIAMSQLSCPAGDRRIDTLSGGERRRVALCRALIARPDLLLLDEPTNHLDTESIQWLGEFLQTYPGAFLLVTHDRYFLDRITDRIVELAQGKTYAYTGNYTDYLVAKAERDATAELSEHKRQMFLRRELEWVRRGPKAQTSKAKSRLDRYFAVADQTPVELDGAVDLVIPPAPPLGNRTVELAGVGLELGGRWLFSNLTLRFAAGRRVGITGRNGLGKTTLLKLILGQQPPTTGTVRVGSLTRYNYVDQGRLGLDPERTVLEEISEGGESIAFGDTRLSLRAYLKRFLFADERISTQVKHLSGGERSRLILARILKQGGNFLILDEPTNDLDLPTLRVVEEALVAFGGVVVVVSHDRYFLNRVCTDILAFEGDGRLRHCVGDYDAYLEQRARQGLAASGSAPRPATTPPGATASRLPGARPRKLSFKESRELEGIQTAIQAGEADQARLEALFAEPDFHRVHGHRTSDIVAELAAAKSRVAQLYARWEELEAIGAGSPQGTAPPPPR